ncbi:MAG: hypothetical protein KC636_25800 [Myxococcales bacterium]|nr:hypothetical protein [Myxococcales bacterium]
MPSRLRLSARSTSALLLAWLVASPARAEPSPAPAPEPASEVAGDGLPEGAAGPPMSADEARRVAEGKQLYESKRFAESARMFEQLWSDTQRPQHLFHAAFAREAGGDHAHALTHLRRYIALPGLGDDARRDAQERIDRSLRWATPVTLIVRPDQATPRVEVRLTRRDGVVDGPFTLVRADDEPHFIRMELEPGDWLLEASAVGYKSASTTLTLRPGDRGGSATVSLEVIPTPVSIRVTPGEAIDAGASLHLLSGPGIANASSEPLASGVTTRPLYPGAWVLEVRAPGYASVRQELALGHEAVELAFTLEAVAPPPPPVYAGPRREPHRVGAAALGTLGGALVASGVGLLVGGGVRLNDAIDRNNEAMIEAGIVDPLTFKPELSASAAARADAVEGLYPRASYLRDLCGGLRLQAIGAGLVGGGAGFVASSIAVGLRAPRWVHWLTIGVGGATAIAGGVGLGLVLPRWYSFSTVPGIGSPYSHLRVVGSIVREHEFAQVPYALAAGLGGGLILGGITGLLVRRAQDRATLAVSPAYWVGGYGVTLQGRF